MQESDRRSRARRRTDVGEELVASIQEVKAGLAQAAEHGNTSRQQLMAAVRTLDNMLSQLHAVSAGTGHHLVSEAIGRCEQAKRQLEESAGLIHHAGESTRRYAGILGQRR